MDRELFWGSSALSAELSRPGSAAWLGVGVSRALQVQRAARGGWNHSGSSGVCALSLLAASPGVPQLLFVTPRRGEAPRGSESRVVNTSSQRNRGCKAALANETQAHAPDSGSGAGASTSPAGNRDWLQPLGIGSGSQSQLCPCGSHSRPASAPPAPVLGSSQCLLPLWNRCRDTAPAEGQLSPTRGLSLGRTG